MVAADVDGNEQYTSKNDICIRIVNTAVGDLVFKTIISQPMETGARKNSKTGRLNR